MKILLSAALLLQTAVTAGAQEGTAEARRDSVSTSARSSAFHDAGARTLLDRARVARVTHDSSLESYDATARQRISAGLGFKALGRDRLAFRHESVSRVRWRRGVGAWIDVQGMRTAIPVLPELRAEVEADADFDMTPIPYFPGREPLWIGTGVSRAEVDEREIVHPLAEGAEAYYRYAAGDSASFRLPDGKIIRLAELRVEARRPRWNLVVGSFWFDASTAQLVRAAYRLAVPMDIVQVARESDDDDDGIPRWLRPMTAQVKGITIEYGLHEGRWWLPRVQSVEGEARVSLMRVPFSLEESFRYASVNGRDTLPTPLAEYESDSTVFAADLAVDSAAWAAALGDSAARDSVRARRREWRRARDAGDAMVRVRGRFGGALRVAVRMPKDKAALRTAPEFEHGLFDEGEDLFGESERALLMKALDFGLQAGWSPQRPALHLPPGYGLLRYNRVEGLSAGVGVSQELGRGFSAAAEARLGVADLSPNGELRVARTNGRRTYFATAYRRLGVANDWGTPLSLGASLNAFLFARDEGLYYRAWGAELGGTRDEGALISWRLFGERHGDASVETQFSLAHALNDVRFLDNIDATNGTVGGAAVRVSHSLGVDPRGFRLLTDARAEAAGGDFDYARGALDVTVTRGLLRSVDGALTLGAGTSGGRVPVQRLWYLGGAETVRGHRVGVAAGDAYWMARAELGTSSAGLRPVVFYDLGWAGSRRDWAHPGQPISGAGVGASLLDGLLRFDVAKGIRPDRDWRANFYVEARF